MRTEKCPFDLATSRMLVKKLINSVSVKRGRSHMKVDEELVEKGVKVDKVMLTNLLPTTEKLVKI